MRKLFHLEAALGRVDAAVVAAAVTAAAVVAAALGVVIRSCR